MIKLRAKGFVRRELGRRARSAIVKYGQSSTDRGSGPGQRSGQERNFWAGYHLAYREMACGQRPFVDERENS